MEVCVCLCAIGGTSTVYPTDICETRPTDSDTDRFFKIVTKNGDIFVRLFLFGQISMKSSNFLRIGSDIRY